MTIHQIRVLHHLRVTERLAKACEDPFLLYLISMPIHHLREQTAPAEAESRPKIPYAGKDERMAPEFAI